MCANAHVQACAYAGCRCCNQHLYTKHIYIHIYIIMSTFYLLKVIVQLCSKCLYLLVHTSQICGVFARALSFQGKENISKASFWTYFCSLAGKSIYLYWLCCILIHTYYTMYICDHVQECVYGGAFSPWVMSSVESLCVRKALAWKICTCMCVYIHTYVLKTSHLFARGFVSVHVLADSGILRAWIRCKSAFLIVFGTGLGHLFYCLTAWYISTQWNGWINAMDKH